MNLIADLATHEEFERCHSEMYNTEKSKSISVESEVIETENNKNLELLQLEVSLLRRLVKEQEEKNCILLENNELLKEKIRYLENFSKSNGEANCESPDKTVITHKTGSIGKTWRTKWRAPKE